jgi:hypothetical protein
VLFVFGCRAAEGRAKTIRFTRRRTLFLAASIPVAAGLAVAAYVGQASSPERSAAAVPRSLAPERAGDSGAGRPQATSRRQAKPGKPTPAPLKEVKHDRSPPLKTIPPKHHQGRKEREERKIPVPAGSSSPDPVVQTSAPKASAPALDQSFAGMKADGSAPPDTNGAAGPAHYVQIVNQSFEVFTKKGVAIYGPAATNTLWTGFGGDCETYDDGDATVAYDRLANRWIIQQFAVSGDTYYECIAVSATGDPTGAYNRYAFSGFGTEFPDYPKLGVWPDAYYVTYNLFENGDLFDGPEVCAYNRAKMLDGDAAGAAQCFAVNDLSLGALLPSDLDGPTPPPAGSPNFIMGWNTDALELWKFHVDWTTPVNSDLTGPTDIAVAPFNPACDGSACIPQNKTSQRLDSLGDRLMYRLAYRNFGDHESIVATHSVDVGSGPSASTGMRWYEVRDPDGTPTVYQQGTYAPDSKFRWMGSIAMDGSGDIALGYSISSGSTYPAISFTGRLAGDPLGTMTQGEGQIWAGGGSQTGGLERWGDYSSMSIDPKDDCTFWYTNEFIPATGSFNWQTRIASFKLPGCVPAVSDDFSLAPTPTSVTIQQGTSGDTTVQTTVTTGSAQPLTLSATGLPFGTTASFGPASIDSGDASTMTFDVGADTPIGTFPITVVGTGASAIELTTVSLTVKIADAVSNGGFESGPASWNTGGGLFPIVSSGKKKFHTGLQGMQLGSAVVPTAGDSTLTQTVTVPGGTSSLSFWYQPRCKGKLPGDAIQAELRDTGGATLATVLNTCVKTGGWRNVVFDTSAYAGQDVVLWFNDHGAGMRQNYFLLDDVTLTRPTPANSVQNPGFETGDLTSWTPGGVSAPGVTTSPVHSGIYAGTLGAGGVFDGHSTITQTVVVPGISPLLRFYYQPHCDDTIDFDQISMDVRVPGGPKTTVLFTCANSSKWIRVAYDLLAFAGQSVILSFDVHDDGFAGDPTYALVDDVSVSSGG